MFASFMMRAHFPVSAPMQAANASGEFACASSPTSLDADHASGAGPTVDHSPL
jgi:hypothetical protein